MSSIKNKRNSNEFIQIKHILAALEQYKLYKCMEDLWKQTYFNKTI